MLEPPTAQPGGGAVPVAGLGTGGLSPSSVDTPGIPPSPAAATALPPLEHELIAGRLLPLPCGYQVMHRVTPVCCAAVHRFVPLFNTTAGSNLAMYVCVQLALRVHEPQ
jgi:hypothetical protein